jgi:hypothetical protein
MAAAVLALVAAEALTPAPTRATDQHAASPPAASPPAASPAAAVAADLAAATPVAAVAAVLDSLERDGVADLRPLFCAERRDGLTRDRVLAGLIGLEPTSLLDGVGVTIGDRAVTVEDRAGGEATVTVSGRLEVTVDALAAAEDVRSTLEAMGQPADETSVSRFLDAAVGALPSAAEGSVRLRATREDGTWLVCDDLAFERVTDAGPSADPREDLCALVEVTELSDVSAIPFVIARSEPDGCTFVTGPDVVPAVSLSIRLVDGELAPLRDLFPRGQDRMIVDRVAFATDLGTWIDLGNRLLLVQPIALATPVDDKELAAAIAELLIPRLS